MKRIWIVGLCVLLSACAAKQKTTSNTPLPEVSGAKSGVQAISQFLQEQQAATPHRPGALVGIFATTHLSLQPSKIAKTGIIAIEALQLISPAGAITDPTTSAIATIQQLSLLLSTNVSDLLNRSTDRSAALESYLGSLRSAMTQGTQDQATLADEIKALKAELSTTRDQVNDTNKSLRDAEKVNDYVQAATLKQELSSLKTKQTEQTETISNREDIQSDLKKLLTKADERVKAVENNREALITGVRLQESPGLDDLDLVTGRTTKRKTSPGTVFGY